MNKFLNFLKDLPGGDLYEIDCSCYDDFDQEITVYVHVDQFGKVRSFPNCKKVSVSKLIKQEISSIEEELEYLKKKLCEVRTEIQILKELVCSSDNDLLKDFFEVKDFSDNAFKTLRNKLTSPYLEVRILSENEGRGELSHNYVHVPSAHVLYGTYYDIYDDIKCKRETEIELISEIEELEIC